MSKIVKMSFGQTETRCKQILKAKRVPMIWGSPGIGKSALAKQIAEAVNLFLIDLRLTEVEAPDLLGYARVNQDTGRSEYCPFSFMPLAKEPATGLPTPLPTRKTTIKEPVIDPSTGQVQKDGFGNDVFTLREVEKQYDGFLIFLDELSGADENTQKAAYRIILDRAVGEHPLHENAYVMAAGNLSTDGAASNDFNTALQSRVWHLHMEANAKQWVDWAAKENLDYRVTSFVEAHSDKFYTFDEKNTEDTFSCPRTLHALSDVLQGMTTPLEMSDQGFIAGCIGTGSAHVFMQHAMLGAKLPTTADIVADPKNTALPAEQNLRYLLAARLAGEFNDTSTPALLTYLERWMNAGGKDTAVTCIRRAVMMTGGALGTKPEVRKLIQANVTQAVVF